MVLANLARVVETGPWCGEWTTDAAFSPQLALLGRPNEGYGQSATDRLSLATKNCILRIFSFVAFLQQARLENSLFLW